MLKKMLGRFEEYLVWPLMATLSGLVFLQVVARYALHIPMPWIEELLRVLFIWLIMLSSSIGIKRRAHLGLTTIMAAMPPKVQPFFFYLGSLAVIITCVIFVSATVDIMMIQKNSRQMLISLPAPIYLSTLALPIGYVLIAVRTIESIFTAAKTRGFFNVART